MNVFERIPLHLLEALWAFEKSGSVEAAARLLATTQPTVSRQLQQVQQYFKSPLFRRDGRNKTLSSVGTGLCRVLGDRLDGLDDALRRFRLERDDPKSVRLRVIGRREILARLLANRSFSNPVSLVSCTGNEVSFEINAGRCDAAVTSEKINTAEYIRKPIFADEMVVAVPRAWAEEADLEGFFKVASTRPYATYNRRRDPLLRAPNSMGLNSLAPTFEFDDWQSLERRVAEAKNWALLPSSYVAARPNYRVYPFDSSNSARFYLYYRRELAASSFVRECFG
jgi:DNA-binding transcriptional LysR family regulator